MNWIGMRKAKPFGFYIPYRYAVDVPILDDFHFHEHLSRHKFFPLNWMIHKNDDSALLIENGLKRSA